MNIAQDIEKLKAWWYPLVLREKMAVAIGGSFLVLVIFYLAVWSPIQNHIQTLRTRIANEQKTLLWMRAADEMLGKMNQQSSVKSKPVSLVVFLSQMQKKINQSGLESFLTQLKQSDNESVEIHFQKVEFDKLIKLLMTVMKEYPATVSRLSITASDAPGYVSADVWVRQG